MTNKEKFIEIFKQEPDDTICPVFCSEVDDSTCPYLKSSWCEPGDWWDMEYKDESEVEDGNVD